RNPHPSRRGRSSDNHARVDERARDGAVARSVRHAAGPDRDGMRSFLDWYRQRGFRNDRPWLVFGKGPSFAKRASVDVAPFYTLALNHAVREQSVIVAHMIDLDVLDQCGSAIDANAA